MDTQTLNPLAAVLQTFLKDAVADAVGPAVRDALDARLPNVVRRAATPEWQSRLEAASYIGVSPRTIDGLRKARKLAWTKRRGRVMLRTRDLDAYLEAGRVPATGGRTA